MRGKITALVAAVAAAAAATSAAKWVRGRKDEELELELEVTAAPDQPTARSAAPAKAAAPAGEPAPTSPSTVAPEAADDLTAIKGLGKVKAAKLVAAGVTSYAQVAAWTDEDIAEMGLVSNTSPGQIKREDWVGQARALAED